MKCKLHLAMSAHAPCTRALAGNSILTKSNDKPLVARPTLSLWNQTLGKSERRVWEIGWGGSVHSGMLLALIICLLMLA